MTEVEMAQAVKHMFMRLCDVGATVEESLMMIALLLGKELATYAPDRAAATDWLKRHDALAMQAYEKLTAAYQREGHPLARRNPH